MKELILLKIKTAMGIYSIPEKNLNLIYSVLSQTRLHFNLSVYFIWYSVFVLGCFFLHYRPGLLLPAIKNQSFAYPISTCVLLPVLSFHALR